jgi:hypothetical protein
MSSFIRFFFFWLFPAPKVGAKYFIEGFHEKDEYVIINHVEDGWVKYQYICGEYVGISCHRTVNSFNHIYSKLKS